MKKTILIPAMELFVAGFTTAIGLQLSFTGPGIGAIVCLLAGGAGLFKGIGRLKQLESPDPGRSDAEA